MQEPSSYPIYEVSDQQISKYLVPNREMSERLEPRSMRDGGVRAREMEDLEHLAPGSTRDGGVRAREMEDSERLEHRRARNGRLRAREMEE
ncbi:hypothetical protein NL676_009402 [Syzygium grande]|nr:hypothetical protein NL676_009402 [Syzygium grande]